MARDASNQGLGESQLRGPNWQHVTRRVYAPAGSLAALTDTAGAFALVLPRLSGFGHLTAAALRRWWLPWLPTTLPLLATTTSGVHVQRPGLYVRRSQLATFEDLDGLCVVDPATSLLEMAVDLSIVDLVPMVDVALRTDACAYDAIAELAHSRLRGARNLRHALRLSDPRSESPWETILRLIHVVSGFDVVPQRVIADSNGLEVARADLWLARTRRIHEYDGADHRTAAQHRKDLGREKALARLGCERFGFTASEIVRRPSRIIADAEDAYGLEPDPVRRQRWYAVAAESTLTAGGRRRLRERLERYTKAAER